MRELYFDETMRVAVFLLVTLLVGVKDEAFAQRSPEFDREVYRADLAWRGEGSLLEAKVRLDRVLAVYPADYEALRLRAQVLLALDRRVEALRDARLAHEILPNDPETLLVLCEAARLNDDLQTAREALDAATSLLFRNAPLHARLAWNAEHLGLLNRAEGFARLAVLQDPLLGVGYLLLARIFMRRGVPEAAASVLADGLSRNAVTFSMVREEPMFAPLSSHPALLPFSRSR